MTGWVVNRSAPRLWCRLFHRSWWFSNDFGTWWTSGRQSFEVRCIRCGDCWTENAALAQGAEAEHDDLCDPRHDQHDGLTLRCGHGEPVTRCEAHCETRRRVAGGVAVDETPITFTRYQLGLMRAILDDPDNDDDMAAIAAKIRAGLARLRQGAGTEGG